MFSQVVILGKALAVVFVRRRASSLSTRGRARVSDATTLAVEGDGSAAAAAAIVVATTVVVAAAVVAAAAGARDGAWARDRVWTPAVVGIARGVVDAYHDARVVGRVSAGE